MELEIATTAKVFADAITVVLPVEYGDEDIPENFPLRINNSWRATIDIATGIIRDWPKGKSGRMHMKVVDQGSYYLMARGITLATREDDYVPECLPGSYGDYIEFDIDENGRIAKWEKFCTASNVAESFFKEDA